MEHPLHTYMDFPEEGMNLRLSNCVKNKVYYQASDKKGLQQSVLVRKKVLTGEMGNDRVASLLLGGLTQLDLPPPARGRRRAHPLARAIQPPDPRFPLDSRARAAP